MSALVEHLLELQRRQDRAAFAVLEASNGEICLLD